MQHNWQALLNQDNRVMMRCGVQVLKELRVAAAEVVIALVPTCYNMLSLLFVGLELGG